MGNPGLGTLIGCAAALAFAGVLCFAAVIARFAAALTLAFILPFTGMLPFFSVCEGLQRDSGMRGACARGVGTNREGTRH